MSAILQATPAIIPSIVGSFILITELALLLTRQSRSKSAFAIDRLSIALLWGTIITGIAVAIPFGYFHIPESLHFKLGESGLILAISLLIIGFTLRCWSIRTLGRLFTVNVAIHQEHHLVSAGPYAFIRHPSYTGLLLEFLALALTFQHGISLLLIMIPTLLALMHRITIEEHALECILGGEYRAYQQQTYVLVPLVY